ncbi:MAG: MMPL family transporter [Actinomycetota bacterium]|nr:MMPL family transporter [Actinomycetota bacterium]
MSRRGPNGEGAKPTGLAGLVARAMVALRWPILLFWLGAAVVLTTQLPTVQEAQVGALGDLVPTDADAVSAEIRSHQLFAFPLLSRTIVVQRDPSGLSSKEQLRVGARALAINRGEIPGLTGIGGALAITNALGAPPFSKERSTTALTYLFVPPGIGAVGRAGLARRFVERHVEPGFEGFVGVTGTIRARTQQAQIVAEHLPLVELATLVLVLLAVGLHFRALGAPLANLAAVAVSYLVSIRLIAYIGERSGVSVPSEVEPVMVVLLFGVVTDWSIFFLSRFRQRLAEGETPHEAAERGTAQLLPIIVTAGLTVAGGSAALVFAKLGFLQAFGPGLAMSVLIALAVSITLVPALLAIGGRALFWPMRPGPEVAPEDAGEDQAAEHERRSGRWRALRLASTRPLLTALVCCALLLAAATGLLRLNLGNPLIRGLPEDSETREAYAQASQGFAPGILSPTVVVVEGPGVVRRRAALARFQRLLDRQPGVAEVVGPADQPLTAPFGAVLSRTGNAARFFVILAADPLGGPAIADFRHLERRAPALLARAGIPEARATFAGDTALMAETAQETVQDLGRTGPVVALAIFLILAVFLRALVAPLYLLVASALALLAALGVAVYLFQDVLGYGDLTYYVPFAAAVLLVALGSDYNVFLAGRIWQEARWRPIRQAVTVAGAQAATPITVAGLVLAGSFAALALVPIRSFQELAFTMALGLLIDAFLVRTLLVPALIVLFGRLSGWPGRRLVQAESRAAPG